jgi:hypothetical protein
VEHDEWRASLRRVHAHRAGLGLELARGHPPMASSDDSLADRQRALRLLSQGWRAGSRVEHSSDRGRAEHW